jgi:hypothetical protein
MIAEISRTLSQTRTTQNWPIVAILAVLVTPKPGDLSDYTCHRAAMSSQARSHHGNIGEILVQFAS